MNKGAKTIELLEENLGGYFYYFWVTEDFLEKTVKACITEDKTW